MKEINFCHKCGSGVSDGAFFCQKCGASLEIGSQIDTPSTKQSPSALIETKENKGLKVCADCGEANQIYQAACHNCNKTTFLFPQPLSKIEEEIVVAVDGETKEPRYQPHGSKFGFGLMAFLVVVAASIFYVQNHQGISSSSDVCPYGNTGCGGSGIYSTGASQALDNQVTDNVVTTPSQTLESDIQGGTCQSEGEKKFQEGYSFTCVKAGRSITNLSAKKLIWEKSTYRKLEWTTSTSSTISVLNSLHLGYWKKSETPDYSDFDGQVFISSLPCKIYMANSAEAQLFIWNREVNGNGYGGTWVHTDAQFWVVNEPNYGPAKCVSYFSLNYGGQRITQ